MQGETKRGGLIAVYCGTVEQCVMVGTKAYAPKTKRGTIECIPLTSREARNMANWLMGAANALDEAGSSPRSSPSMETATNAGDATSQA
jgi:hypothetical protein